LRVTVHAGTAGKARLAWPWENKGRGWVQGGRLGRTSGRPAAGLQRQQRACSVQGAGLGPRHSKQQRRPESSGGGQLSNSGGQSKMQSEGGGGLGQAEGLAGRLACSSSGHDAAEKEGSGRQ